MARSNRKALLGSEQPRIATPPLRKLNRYTSLGYEVADFAREVLGVDLLPWQRRALIRGMELLPDGSFRFRTVLILVARQNGKSMLSTVLALYFMLVRRSELVLGTAQDLDTSEETWQNAVDLVESLPEVARHKRHVSRVNGQKSLQMTDGQRYKVKSANRKASRGMSADLILLDELREHQTWDAWGAVTKTTMARPDAQVWAFSNAGDATSVVLRYLRKLAHQQVGDPDGINKVENASQLLESEGESDLAESDDSLALLEWSAEPSSATDNRAQWAQANPALGHMITERTVTSAMRTDPERVFRTEVLCQWPAGAATGPFPAGAWEECFDEDSEIAPDSSVSVAMDVSWDRKATYIAVAGWRDDGLPHVEVVAAGSGTDWAAPWLASPERHESIRGCRPALQARGAPVSNLIRPLREAGVEVTEWQGADLGRATGTIYDRVAAHRLRHRGQPPLDAAAITAVTKSAGDGTWWDRRNSPNDAAPMVAITAALFYLGVEFDDEPMVSAYEARRLEVL